MKKIAVIGAGLCGAAAAQKLTQQGYQVTVFDKGRAAGGRMSSKRTEQGYLDLGAQYFTARTEVFQQQVQRWCEAGQAELWCCTPALLSDNKGVVSLQGSEDQQKRFIGVPAMHSPVRALLQGIKLVSNCCMYKLCYQQQSWTLSSGDGQSYSGFAAVLVTLPPLQAQQLLSQSGLPELVTAAADLLEPCWAVAVKAQAIPCGDAIFCQHAKLRFISHQQQKTGRNSCYILHFNAAFSALHLDEPAEFWLAQASQILRQELDVKGDITPLVAHRWLYASQKEQVAAPGLLALSEQHLWVGADWSYGGRVENAYLAGLDLAQAVMAQHDKMQEM